MLKAKIMTSTPATNCCIGFSNPSFAHEHLDFPRCAFLACGTYDSIGHVVICHQILARLDVVISPRRPSLLQPRL